MLLLFGFGFVYNRYKLKKEAELSRELAAQQLLRFRATIEAEEKERTRIAREMHDGIGPLLSAAKLNIAAMKYAENGSGEAVLENSIALINDAVKEVRTISHNLMPSSLTDLGMVPALQELIRKINDTGTVTVEMDISGQQQELAKPVEIAVYRIVQEVVNNMLKHARATVITILLQYGPDRLELYIEDDGTGFDTSAIKTSSGIGWRNIFSRADMLHGSVQVASEPGSGTSVAIEIPLGHQEQAK